MKTIPGFLPSGMLRMSNFVPDKIVEFTHSHQLIKVIASYSITNHSMTPGY